MLIRLSAGLSADEIARHSRPPATRVQIFCGVIAGALMALMMILLFFGFIF